MKFLSDVLIENQQFCIYQLANKDLPIRFDDDKPWFRCLGFTSNLNDANDFRSRAQNLTKLQTRIHPCGRNFLATNSTNNNVHDQEKSNRDIETYLQTQLDLHAVFNTKKEDFKNMTDNLNDKVIDFRNKPVIKEYDSDEENKKLDFMIEHGSLEKYTEEINLEEKDKITYHMELANKRLKEMKKRYAPPSTPCPIIKNQVWFSIVIIADDNEEINEPTLIPLFSTSTEEELDKQLLLVDDCEDLRYYPNFTGKMGVWLNLYNPKSEKTLYNKNPFRQQIQDNITIRVD